VERCGHATQTLKVTAKYVRWRTRCDLSAPYRSDRVIALEATVLSEDPDFLQARLGHARRRLDEAMPYSPDWDAAAEAVDDLKQRLERALSERLLRV
jgi:hypothetical protein